jgi:DNA-binding cell septation regulator SpoVG
MLEDFMKIKVVEIRLLPFNGKPTQGFADVQFDMITIRDFKILKEEGKRPYVKVPFQTYRGQTGELKFRPMVILPDEVRGEVDLAILNAYQREKEKENERRNSN